MSPSYLVVVSQAATLTRLVTHVPGLTTLSSSLRDQSSYSHRHDPTVGQALADQMTYVMSTVIADMDGDLSIKHGDATLADLVHTLANSPIITSTVHFRQTVGATPAHEWPLQQAMGLVVDRGGTVVAPLSTPPAADPPRITQLHDHPYPS